MFNYFPPDATIPGTSILGPEFAHPHDGNSAVTRTNLVYTLVYGGYAPDATIPTATGTRLFLRSSSRWPTIRPRWSTQVNQMLAGGQFPAAQEPTIVTAVNAIALSATPTAAAADGPRTEWPST